MSSHYIIENGFRKVKPYYHTFETFVKGRWFDRTPTDVFISEFKEHNEHKYKSDIVEGRMKVVRNSKSSLPTEIIMGDALFDTQLKSGDILVNENHIHEPSVPVGQDIFDLDETYKSSIPIVYEDQDILVVNKPSGIPVHPTGRFYYNSVTEVLKHDLNLDNLYPCHRLDKLTSGVLLLAKNNASASRYGKMILQKSVRKEYLARVRGKFSDFEVTCKDPIFNINSKYGYLSGEPKDAESTFRSIKYNSSLDQSLVLCKPITGRTHQLRIHLRNLGHPIVNDPLFGPKSSAIKRNLELKLTERAANGHPYDDLISELSKVMEENTQKGLNLLGDGVCEQCGKQLYQNRLSSDNVIWLHAKKYFSDEESWIFETNFPKWCNI